MREEEELDMDGPPKIVRRRDGLWVVGGGWLVPVSDREQGEAFIRALTRKRARPDKEE